MENPFLKENKKKFINVFRYPASKAFIDKDGNPEEWKFRRLDTEDERKLALLTNSKANNLIGFMGEAEMKYDWLLYWRNKLAMACLYPDLEDNELQNSYGAQDKFELFDRLLDDPDEFANLILKYQEEFIVKREWFGEQK